MQRASRAYAIAIRLELSEDTPSLLLGVLIFCQQGEFLQEAGYKNASKVQSCNKQTSVAEQTDFEKGFDRVHVLADAIDELLVH